MLQLPGRGDAGYWGRHVMQKAQPRDIGALALVVALFVVLFVLSVTLGSPPR
jgi:hypothetical protein